MQEIYLLFIELPYLGACTAEEAVPFPQQAPRKEENENMNLDNAIRFDLNKDMNDEL